MARFATPEDEWRSYLNGTHPHIVWGRKTFRHIPSSPLCKVCLAPFGTPGGPLFRRMGFHPVGEELEHVHALHQGAPEP